LHTTLTTTVGL